MEIHFELYQRKFKLIDADLYSFYKRTNAKDEKWHYVKLYKDKVYKQFKFTVDGKIRNVQYHRAVYYAHNQDWDFYDTSKENFIDHIEHQTGVPLDNSITNLRIVTNQENQFNMDGVKGYTYIKKRGKYRAQIILNKKTIHLGYFITEAEARQAYLDAKKIYHKIIPK